MENYPRSIKTRGELNLRLGIKSSLSQLRPVIASLYILFKVGKRKSKLVYSYEIKSNGLTSIKLEEGLRKEIKAVYGDEDFPNLIEKSQLFTSQLEAIQVALELFFHLAKIDFVNSGLSERTGYSRYNKKVSFSTNMLLVDLFLSDKSNNDVIEFLHSWLQDKSNGSDIEKGIQLLLNTFTEETQYKIRNDIGEIVFNQEGVYSEILDSKEVTSKDKVEPVGPFRVYKSYISSGLHPFLSENRQTISLRDNVDVEVFKNYAEMVDTSLSLLPKRSVVTQEVAIHEEKTSDDIEHSSNTPLQQIFYGAPGTGKSHKIKDDDKVKAADDKNLVFRTTFHPDSDYSTFVGAYKPTMRSVPNQYKAVAGKDEEITYSFVPQAFLQAYVAAWNNLDDKVFLVIEEINRGNCAQIFGDLFQLLDRDENGWSEYPIMADKDLTKFLNGNDEEGQPVLTNKGGINDGKLCLPKNLYIWATMNTSDQSLFPIDSAFKRRWDWVYMPISDAKKNYVIEIDNDQYDWWSFLEAINAIIESTIHSEDKKLGYFFAKAKDGRITVETFVSKVIFYLWNDVFKDNETNHKAFKDNDGELLPFRKFFNHDGTVDTNMVIKFLQDLEVFPFEHSDDGTMVVSDTTPNTKRQRDKSRYRVNGTDNLNKAQMTREAFRLYIEAHPDADAQTIAQAWNGLGLKDYVQHLVETEAEFNARTKDSTDTNKRATEFELSNGEKIYLSTQFGIGNIGKFMDAVNNAGWNIRIENQD